MEDNSEMMRKLKHLLAKRDDEQVQLQELNGRFASYIKKIRSLEQKNQTLEGEVQRLKSQESTSVTELYEEEINQLRMQLERQNKHSSSLEDLNDRLQKANDEKEEVLKKLASLKEDLDASTQASKFLEEEIKTLRDQLAFHEKIHKEKTKEIQELQIRFEEVKNNVQTDGANSDLAEMLQELKAQFQNSANTKSSETEKWYKSQMSEMKETVNNNNETLRKLSQENTNLKSQNQKNLREISSLKATIEEMEERSQTLQETITTLETEKNQMKDDMKIQLLEYQDLLKEKGDLDREIGVYRKLLEKEESRLKKNPEEENTSRTDSPQTSDAENDSDKFSA